MHTGNDLVDYLGEGVKLCFFLVILIANSAFFLIWIVEFFKTFKGALLKRAPKIYLYLCVCGSQRALDRHREITAADDENQFLREDYLRSKNTL